MKKRNSLISVIALLLVVILAVGSSSETDTPVKVEKPSVEEPSEEDVDAVSQAAPEVFNIGDTVKMGDLEFTLNSVRFDEGSQYLKPDDGEKWLVVDCTAVNNGTESTTISSMLMVSIYDSEHYAKDMAFGAELKGSFDGELGAGRTLRGEIAYSVGAEETAWELIFEPNVFGFGQAIYYVNIE